MVFDVEYGWFVNVGLLDDIVCGLVDWFDVDGYGVMLLVVEKVM